MERRDFLTVLGAAGLTGCGGGNVDYELQQSPKRTGHTLHSDVPGYEEGTWTPIFYFSLGSTGITYTDRVGSYVQIGRLIYCQYYIQLSSKGSSTGIARLSGHPMTPGGHMGVSSWSIRSIFNPVDWAGSLTSYIAMYTRGPQGAPPRLTTEDYFEFMGKTGAGTSGSAIVLNTDISDTFTAFGQLVYFSQGLKR